MTYEEAVNETAKGVLAEGFDSVVMKNHFEVMSPEIYRHIEDYAIQAEVGKVSRADVAESVAAFVYACLSVVPKYLEANQKPV